MQSPIRLENSVGTMEYYGQPTGWSIEGDPFQGITDITGRHTSAEEIRLATENQIGDPSECGDPWDYNEQPIILPKASLGNPKRVNLGLY